MVPAGAGAVIAILHLLLAVAGSTPGLFGIAGLFVGLAVFAVELKWPRDLAWIFVAAAAVWFTLGATYREGERACEARHDAAVAEVKAADAVTVAATGAALDAQAADNKAAFQDVDRYAAELAARPKQKPECILDQSDADDINR